MAKVGNWTAENCATAGTGNLVLAGAVEGGVTFQQSLPVGEVWYSIVDGLNRETGVGTFDGLITIIRTTVYSTLTNGIFNDNGPSPISLSGGSVVACTMNATAFNDMVDAIAQNAADILTNASGISQNASDIGTNASGISQNAQDISDNTTAIGVNAADIVVLEAIPPFGDYLAGYEATGLHTSVYTGNIDDIIVNSNYLVGTGTLGTLPSGFNLAGFGFLTTDMSSSDAARTQTLKGMIAPNEYKVWMRHATINVYSAWELVVDGIPSAPISDFAGMVGQFAFAPALPWIDCDGSAISRTTYPDLFAAIGVTYGNGNGSTTFNVPDYRGEFLRTTADGTGRDPDRASRTNRGDGTTGDAVGTKQGHQLNSHGHSSQFEFALFSGGTLGNAGTAFSTTPVTVENTGGNETRGRNVYVNQYIHVGNIAT